MSKEEVTLVSTKETDYLDEDKQIRGQNYVLMSFISPEDVLINKEVYYFTKFLEKFSKDMTTLYEGILAKYPDSKDLLDTVKSNHGYIFNDKEMNEQYNFFKSVNSTDIESEFHKNNNFRTTMRGIKIRGVFDTMEEAKNRIEFLKKVDKNFDIYVGQVGCWCPWSPNPNDLDNQEYAETQLNTLMKEYKKNMESKDDVFEKRKQEAIDAAKSNQKTPIETISESLEETDPWTARKQEESQPPVDETTPTPPPVDETTPTPPPVDETTPTPPPENTPN
jgi:hypothetical protein